MEDAGEVELSDNVLFPNPNSSSVDSFFDEFLRNTTTCTHTHTCNPPGPDSTVHTHTCYHTHTQVISSEDDHSNGKQRSSLKPRRPSGNREAVRKYREKKKAHTAYLEEEVKKLRLLNQQLVRKLQGQTALEAEILRLRSLLVDLKGKIDGELGLYPFQKHTNTNSSNLGEGDCSMQFQANLPCFLHPRVGGLSEMGKMVVSWEGSCPPANIDCPAKRHGIETAKKQKFDAIETRVSGASVQAE